MKVSKIHGNGNHLLLEGYGGSFNKLNDKNLINKILGFLPGKLDMFKISEPLIVDYEAKDESGISGFVLIAESHISIHTYPRKGFAVMDIFSCKEFNVEEAIEFLKEKFGFEKINKKLVLREYERD